MKELEKKFRFLIMQFFLSITFQIICIFLFFFYIFYFHDIDYEKIYVDMNNYYSIIKTIIGRG